MEQLKGVNAAGRVSGSFSIRLKGKAAVQWEQARLRTERDRVIAMRHISRAMAVAQDSSDHLNWMGLQGMTLAGSYVLDQCLNADERRVVFKAQGTEGDVQAVVKLYRAGMRAGEEQITLWEAIRKLEHPNLLRILSSGRITFNRQDLIYVVLERADETLAQVLDQRPISKDEAGELVLSICRGLEQLHSAGFVHGYVSPEQVLAVGDDIKLSTEGVRRTGSAPDIDVVETRYHAPESEPANVSPESDVWCLGATLFKAMTQKECEPECRGEIANLPVPLSTIVHRCLYKNPESRCTVGDVMQLYRQGYRVFAASAGAGGATAAANAPEPARTSTLVSGDATRASDEPEPADRVTPGALPGRLSHYFVRDERSRENWRIWAFLGIALALLIAGVIWLAHPGRSGAPTPTAPSMASSTPSSTPATQQKVNTTPVHPVTPLIAEKPNPQKTYSQKPQAVQRPVWRVITYTYHSKTDAERKAKSINGKHPDLRAEVFSPNSSGPYLVVVGGQMSREKAAAVRQRALRDGLPRDSYIQNYAQ